MGAAPQYKMWADCHLRCEISERAAGGRLPLLAELMPPPAALPEATATGTAAAVDADGTAMPPPPPPPRPTRWKVVVAFAVQARRRPDDDPASKVDGAMMNSGTEFEAVSTPAITTTMLLLLLPPPLLLLLLLLTTTQVLLVLLHRPAAASCGPAADHCLTCRVSPTLIEG